MILSTEKAHSLVRGLGLCLQSVLTTLSVVLILGLAVLGVLAYLTDQDSDVNVMTLGKVDIEQNEYERVKNSDGTYATDSEGEFILKSFTQDKPLLPSAIDNESADWDYDAKSVDMSTVDSHGNVKVLKAASNAQDKFVTVKNTGRTDAYVRTLVAIEVGSGSIGMMGTVEMFSGAFGNTSNPWYSPSGIDATINGNNYRVYEYIYHGYTLSDGTVLHAGGVLPAGEVTPPSFCQIYLESGNDNEEMIKLDGNNNGKLDILVLSQAVQTEGFANAQIALDTAFGDVTPDKAAEWFAGMKEN